jgi:hypothetical protein
MIRPILASGLLTAAAACAPHVAPSGSARDTSPPMSSAATSPAMPDPVGWRRVQATGRYSLAVPPSLERRYRQGVDSAVDQFIGDGIQLNLDYGLYGGGFSPDEPGVRTERLPGDGRALRWTVRAADAAETQFRTIFTARLSDPEQPPPTSPFPPPPGPGLTITLHCQTAELCEIGPTIARSVRFGRGRPLSERIVFLRRAAAGGQGTDRLEGPMIVDSDGCLRLTDPEGVPGPVLIWPADARLETVGGGLAVAAGAQQPLQIEGGGYASLRGRRLSTAAEAGLFSPAPPVCAGPAFAVSGLGPEAPGP